MVFEYGERELEFLKARDAKLAAVIERVGHVERAVDPDLFASVVHHIVGQQISTKAQETIWRRMNAELGSPTPEKFDELEAGELQKFGLSFRKVAYLKDFAGKVVRGEFVPARVAQMGDAEAIAALSGLKGVGVWTAEMILLFCLQRPDILSFGDLGIQRGMRMVYRHRKLDRKLFEKYRRRLSPCGSVASLYFWAVSGGALPELTDPALGLKKPRGV